PLCRVFTDHLGEGWLERAADPSTWEPVRAIPNEELWKARREARAHLVSYVRIKSERDRLLRGEPLEYVRAVGTGLDDDILTIGFARRLASYKRLYLLINDPIRARDILIGPQPVQVLIAGKAHPKDEEGKDVLHRLYQLKRGNGEATRRVVFLEDYD